MSNEIATPPANSSPEAPDVIRVTCACGRRLRIKREQAGSRIRCPKCGKTLVARVRDESPPLKGAAQSTAALPASPEFFRRLGDEIGAAQPPGGAVAGRKTLSWLKYRALVRRAMAPDPLREADVLPCRLALLELGQSCDRRAREIILPFASSPSSPLRQAAAVALGDLEDAATAGVLVRLLGDESALVRKAAVIALGKTGNRLAVRPLLLCGLSDPHLKFLALESIVQLGEAAVPALLDLVSNPDAGVALEAVVLLGRIGDKRVVKTLISCAESGSPLVRCHAAEALGRIGDSRARGTLLTLLEHADAGVRANAAAALAKMPDANAVVPLVRALADADDEVRSSAALALGGIGDKRAATPLARLLEGAPAELRLVTAEALARLGDARALPPLVDLLQTPDESIQLKAIAALRRLNDPAAAGPLYDALTSRSPQVRQRAIDALGQIGDAEAAERLESMLAADRSTEVRSAAARALGEIADPASVDALVRALHDEFNVRCVALGAIGAIGGEQAFAVLLQALEDPAAEVRFHAASALANFKHPQAIEALQAAVADDSEMVRRGAAKSLEKLGAPVDRKAAARLQRSRRVRRRVVDWHMALPAFVATWLWPDTVRGRGLVAGLAAALAAAAFLLWPEPNSGRPLARFRGNVVAVAFSPDGTKLAIGRELGVLEIRDPRSGKMLSEVRGSGTGDVTFASDSRTLAVVSLQNLQLRQAGEDGAGRDLTGHQRAIERLVTTPGGEVVATLDRSGRVIVWSLPGGGVLAALDIEFRGLSAIDVTADGKLLAGGADRGRVMIWETDTARLVHTLSGSPANVLSVAFSPDGQRIAASAADGTIRVWDIATGRPLMEVKNEAARAASLLRFHPDGQRLAAVTIATVRLWDLSTKKATALPTFQADLIDRLAFTHDGRQLAAAGSENRDVWIVDIERGQLAQTIRPPE